MGSRGVLDKGNKRGPKGRSKEEQRRNISKEVQSGILAGRESRVTEEICPREELPETNTL